MRALVLALALALVGCASSPKPVAHEERFVRRAFPPGLFERHGICYSGYRVGQGPDEQRFPSDAEIAEDLDLLVRGGWRLIRLFDSGEHAERVLRVIRARRLDLKVFLGVWIAGARAEHDAANRAEIDRAAALVTQYPDTIVAVSVGNETLDDWSAVRTPPAELADYIRQTRRRVAVPVTTDDAWQPFALATVGATSYADVLQVLDTIDFASIHIYAFAEAIHGTWDYKQEGVPEAERARAMMTAAIARTRESARAVRAVLVAHGLADLPIVVGEMGWKSHTMHSQASPPEDAIEVFFAHPVNQRLFYDAVTAWIYGDAREPDGPVASFYFEAFDEPWKDRHGDDGWGLFDVDRHAKLVIQGAFADRTPADAPRYTPADAVFYRP
jgi:exo-beta-1,3-glucanase (GH17 family)